MCFQYVYHLFTKLPLFPATQTRLSGDPVHFFLLLLASVDARLLGGHCRWVTKDGVGALGRAVVGEGSLRVSFMEKQCGIPDCNLHLVDVRNSVSTLRRPVTLPFHSYSLQNGSGRKLKGCYTEKGPFQVSSFEALATASSLMDGPNG